MPITRPRITRPLPRKVPAGPVRHLARPAPGNTTTLTAQLNGWNFQPRIYLAWDGPTAAAPGWFEVTEFVDIQAAIVVTYGRTDSQSDPGTAMCTLTVDNSDGRWSEGNAAGAWAGSIRKGAWLRVDVLPLSGVVSTRYTGFIQDLPTKWEGDYAFSEISCSDRFVLLSQAPVLSTMVAQQWLWDPQGSPYISLYAPLHEPAGASYVSDVSGQAPIGAQSLSVQSIGVSAGAGITFAQAPAPGYDGVSTVNFAPSGTVIGNAFGGSTGALPNGSYLIGNLGQMGQIAQVTCSIQTTVALQPIWSWADPVSGYVTGIALDGAGYVMYWQSSLSQTNPAIYSNLLNGLGRYPLTDGGWHQVSVKLQTVAGTTNLTNSSFIAIVVDGVQVFSEPLGASLATGFEPQATVTRFMLGGAESWAAAAIPAIKSLFTGNISDLVIHSLTSGGIAVNPDWYGANQAATGVWQGPTAAYPTAESCGQRVVRFAAYCGLPVPTETFTAMGPVLTDVALGTTPFINIPAPTSHFPGPQQIVGKQGLTIMQTVAHTENMPLYMNRTDQLTLQPSTLRQNPAFAFTINAADLDPGTEWANDYQYFANQAVITPDGQGAITVNTGGVTSQNLNGLYSTPVDTASQNVLEATSLGAALIAAGSKPPARLAPLQCEVGTLAGQAGYGAAWYDAVLASDVSSALQVTNWPAQAPSATTAGYYIEGYTETIGAGTHMFAWNTSPVQGPTYQCDSATLGEIDTPGITLAY